LPDDIIFGVGDFNVPALISGSNAGFAGIKMILAGFPADDFVVSGYFKAFGCRLVSFYFRHNGG